MSDDIDALGEKIGKTREETITALKDYYDGYHFSGESPDIFNPFSLLNAMSKGKLDYYWFTSGTPTYLINMMKKFDTAYTDFAEGMEADASDFDAPTDADLMTTLTPLLYQSGYITIKGYDKEYDSYFLGRVDMVLRSKTHLYLFELKLNQSSDVAMKQIDLKEYPKRFALCGLPIVKVGINFDMEKHSVTLASQHL